MKLTITSSGKTDDEDIAHITLVAETETHKTTLAFWADFDTFDDFAAGLRSFPFELKDDVIYKFGYSDFISSLSVSLIDAAGHVRFKVVTVESDQENAQFSEIVEAESLIRLSKKLEGIDLAIPSELFWHSSEG